MSETVWILTGTTGEYSDRSEWIVGAYTNEADARADCAALNARAEGLGDLEWAEREEAVAERLTPHDASASADYTGVDYSVGECPVFSAPRVPALAANPTETVDVEDEG